MRGEEGGLCGHPGCPDRSVVGLGANPTWLCLAHFDARLKAARARFDALLATTEE